MKFLLKSEII